MALLWLLLFPILLPLVYTQRKARARLAARDAVRTHQSVEQAFESVRASLDLPPSEAQHEVVFDFGEGVVDARQVEVVGAASK